MNYVIRCTRMTASKCGNVTCVHYVHIKLPLKYWQHRVKTIVFGVCFFEKQNCNKPVIVANSLMYVVYTWECKHVAVLQMYAWFWIVNKHDKRHRPQSPSSASQSVSWVISLYQPPSYYHIILHIYIYIIRPIRNAYLIFKFLCLFPGHITNRHNGILIGSCNGRGFVGYIDDVSTVCIFFLNLDTRCFKSMLLASDIVIICVCVLFYF